ncbi:hypothetical protein [Haliangium sp. UPWRP_2]|uniref:hypothetical protein n=1 Tax=Haliangium sp. UPWRP_2 TaxID=1931276 RepID=UPI0011B1F506|nr:hypothetical protein [Haliangium sp. UPWRP_2]PSM31782.1 hypothetical protein BVG81_003650 [Haliangium sp. UPWRP_2]
MLALTLVLLLAHAALVIGLLVLRQAEVFLLPAWTHLLPALALMATVAATLAGRWRKGESPSLRQYLALTLLSAMSIGIWARPETRALWNASEQLPAWSLKILAMAPAQVCLVTSASDAARDAAPSFPWRCLVKRDLASPIVIALDPTYVSASWDRPGQGQIDLDWGGGFLVGRGLAVGRLPVMSENCRLRRIRDGVWVYQCQDE